MACVCLTRLCQTFLNVWHSPINRAAVSRPSSGATASSREAALTAGMHVRARFYSTCCRACVQSGGHLWLVSLWAPWLWAPWLVPRSAPCQWARWWALRVGRWCATESGALACTSLCFEGATCERAACCMLSCTRAVVQSGRHLLLAPSWVASWALRARTVAVSVRRTRRQPRVSRRPACRWTGRQQARGAT